MCPPDRVHTLGGKRLVISQSKKFHMSFLDVTAAAIVERAGITKSLSGLQFVSTSC